MSIEAIGITAGLIILGLAAVLFMITRRVMRLMVRLALFGGLLLVLTVFGLAWWYGSGRSAATQPKERPSSTGRGRANSR